MPAKPFPYRLVASDLDGTLLGPHKDISAANAAAVGDLRASGAQFILASGRRHQNSVRFHQALNLDGLLISCAGAMVRDPQTGVTLSETTLPPEIADAIVAEGEAAGFTVIYYHRDHLYVAASTKWTDLYESRVAEKAERYRASLCGLRGEGALKVVWYGEPEEVSARRQEAQAHYRGAAHTLSTDDENLEFSAVDANKGRALAIVAEHYGVPQAEVLAFGDGENDAPMLKWAGCGVAMDGSNKVALKAADKVGSDGVPEERFARAAAVVLSEA